MPFSEPKPSVHRVYLDGKPKVQLRQGEEGLSVFDAEKTISSDILPHFRAGSLLITMEIALIESCGLQVVHTPGDPALPEILQQNHMEIRPAEHLTRKQFKDALRALEQSIGDAS